MTIRALVLSLILALGVAAGQPQHAAPAIIRVDRSSVGGVDAKTTLDEPTFKRLFPGYAVVKSILYSENEPTGFEIAVSQGGVSVLRAQRFASDDLRVQIDDPRIKTEGGRSVGMLVAQMIPRNGHLECSAGQEEMQGKLFCKDSSKSKFDQYLYCIEVRDSAEYMFNATRVERRALADRKVLWILWFPPNQASRTNLGVLVIP